MSAPEYVHRCLVLNKSDPPQRIWNDAAPATPLPGPSIYSIIYSAKEAWLRAVGNGALMPMDEQLANQSAVFPLVRVVQSAPSPDGKALLVEVGSADDKLVRFAIPLTDVQHFVAFLLISAGRITAMENEHVPTSEAVGQSPPVPVTSIAVGEPAGEEGYLGIAVGPAELVFSIPISAFDELGRTLLAISADPGRYRS